MGETIFESNYEEYCRQIAKLDVASRSEILGIESHEDTVNIPFFGENYTVTKTGITDTNGDRPGYGVCVVLAKYLLECPKTPVDNTEWASLKDFHKRSQLTNINVFSSDAERPIIQTFSGRMDALLDASARLGGKPVTFGVSYDLSMEFVALPRIKILLLFNDSDDEFPATCSILFQRQAEEYLDPESLIMVGIAFANRLQRLSR